MKVAAFSRPCLTASAAWRRVRSAVSATRPLIVAAVSRTDAAVPRATSAAASRTEAAVSFIVSATFCAPRRICSTAPEA